MNTHLRPAREDDTALGPTDSAGRRLHIARQSRSMTQEQVADELHLKPAIIEALEQQDYKSLPEPVFVTGYVRKYAHLVGLDPEPLVVAYGGPLVRARTNKVPARADRHRTGTRRINASHLAVGMISLGILLLVGILAFLWQWYQRPDLVGSEMTAAEEVAREAVPTDVLDMDPEFEPPTFLANPEDLLASQEVGQSPEPGSDPEISQPQPPTTAAETEDVAEENSDSGTTTATAARPADTNPDAEETEETIAAEADEIEITFNGSCWVNVQDSEQKHKISGSMKKDDRYVLKGKPPYSFILGNVGAVRITVGRKPLDLSTVSRGSVARFTLDADGKVR